MYKKISARVFLFQTSSKDDSVFTAHASIYRFSFSEIASVGNGGTVKWGRPDIPVTQHIFCVSTICLYLYYAHIYPFEKIFLYKVAILHQSALAITSCKMSGLFSALIFHLVDEYKH